jgi:hypothetical protein
MACDAARYCLRVAARHAHVRAVVKALLVVARGQVGDESDGQVHLARFQRLAHLLHRQLHGVQVHARRDLAQPLQQHGQEDPLADVGHDDAEGARRRGGVEVLVAVQCLANEMQRVADRIGQFYREGGRLHAARGPHEQRVVQHLAQLAQAGAHCRLAQADALRRGRDVALCQDGLEGHEQLEVQLKNICFLEYHESFSCDLRMVGRLLHFCQGLRETRRSKCKKASRLENVACSPS